MRNGAWLSAVPNRLNDTELSQEEFQDNLRLRYGLMPQGIPRPAMVVVISYQSSTPYHARRGGLVLAQHDDAAKEWGALGAGALVPSAISYERRP